MALLADASYVRSQILPTLIGHGGRYSNFVNPSTLEDHCIDAIREVEQKLSTRMTVTVFRGWLGPGSKPANIAAVVGPPAVEAIEYEGAYAWPSMCPSDGFLSWKLRHRPVQEVIVGNFRIPGSFAPGIEIKASWMRVDPYGDITLMPQYGSAALVLPNLPFGLFNWMQQRINGSMLWEYRAGMTESDWGRFPQVNRLIGIRAALKYLPVLSLKINPSGLTSQSADGLSQSRSSGYVFKDIEERLKAEADDIQTSILDAWEGTSALGVL
jgi:hypothetical protein